MSSDPSIAPITIAAWLFLALYRRLVFRQTACISPSLTFRAWSLVKLDQDREIKS
ncbi:hypothetical protein H6F89_20365 [Cyanobacteria bacterium FACHB-63]|nr:hypothetical protein [Cyanobacteria bacterium FACHB-63]